ncbi:sarcospan isoform X2 [Canis aureus]
MGEDRQPRGPRRQGGAAAADAAAAAAPDDPGPKPGAGAPKERGEEAARTCCGCRFPLLLALLQLALGIAVTVVGFLMASVSPSLLVRDTPFWAGIIVCLVAYLGLFMLCVSYQVDERTCIQFAMKVLEIEDVPINCCTDEVWVPTDNSSSDLKRKNGLCVYSIFDKKIQSIQALLGCAAELRHRGLASATLFLCPQSVFQANEIRAPAHMHTHTMLKREKNTFFLKYSLFQT